MSPSCAICQPHYLPWMGYFEMIDRVDVFVFLDDVQFIKREWKNRNRIRKGPRGTEYQWLTASVDGKDAMRPINEVRLSWHKDWMAAHMNALRHVYGHTPHADSLLPFIQDILEANRHQTLGGLNMALISEFCTLLGIRTTMLRSSDLKAVGKKEQKLIAICKEIGASSYLANNATATYCGPEDFERHGIHFNTQDYEHPEYAQVDRGKPLPFLSHLSVVDLLCNKGSNVLEVIRKGNCKE